MIKTFPLIPSGNTIFVTGHLTNPTLFKDMERLIDKYLPADYHDTFVLKSRKPAEQIIPKELIKKIFNHSPAVAQFFNESQEYSGKTFGA